MTTLNDTVSSRPLVDVDLGELAAVSAELEHQAGVGGDQVGVGTLRLGLVLAASFQDCVLIDVAVEGRARRSRSCSSTRSTTSPRRSGTSTASASATTST